MYRSNIHTKMITLNIFNHLKHIPSNALVSQWVHFLSHCSVTHKDYVLEFKPKVIPKL